MKNVEHPKRKLFGGFQWADPFAGSKELQVTQVGTDLHIAGLFPRYTEENSPTDLIRECEITAKCRAVGKPGGPGNSPDVLFANAETDEKLVAFVRRFGPIVAKEAYSSFERPESDLAQPHLYAVQSMKELRDEQVIFRSALGLLTRLTESNFDFPTAQRQIGEIAARIVAWPGQWQRERRERENRFAVEPSWNLGADAIERTKRLASAPPDSCLPPSLDGRIVLCELVNAFRPIVFPNPLEMHSTIKYGIRPILYAILRRQLVYPRDVSVCANTQCRNFFHVDRRAQTFCDSECSLHQRQRDYWTNRGKRLRKKRAKIQRKQVKTRK
jgi:hypothetical protein